MPRPLPRPPIKSVIKLLCPNPSVSLTLPPKLTFSCR